MYQAKTGLWSDWNTAGWGTPFTGFRWGIPGACSYDGRAIYMDSDFILRADLRELWDQDMRGAAILVRRPDGKLKTCCMLMDCEAIKPLIPPFKQLRSTRNQNGYLCRVFQQQRARVGAFDGDWNCVDLKGYDDINDPRIKAIHYSKMPCQPHLKYAIPRLKAEGRRHWYDGELAPHWRPELVSLFDDLYTEAQAAGYTVDRYQVPAFGRYTKKSWAHYRLPSRTKAAS
jgi:hypothetical protein